MLGLETGHLITTQLHMIGDFATLILEGLLVWQTTLIVLSFIDGLDYAWAYTEKPAPQPDLIEPAFEPIVVMPELKANVNSVLPEVEDPWVEPFIVESNNLATLAELKATPIRVLKKLAASHLTNYSRDRQAALAAKLHGKVTAEELSLAMPTK